LPFTVEGLEVVKTALSCNLALKLFKPIKGHAGGIGTIAEDDFKGRKGIREGTYS
jgi:hypothetical protein